MMFFLWIIGIDERALVSQHFAFSVRVLRGKKMNVFTDLGLNNEVITAINRLGFTRPTQIQGKSIPHIVKGEDIIGESATGSGKTLAFGCGIVRQVIPGSGLQALILTPTRELAEQVKESIRALSRKLKVIAIYGGVSINPQIDDLHRADVVVGTPGRLLDHIQRRTIGLSRIKVLVLDEADRMLDMGFVDDVEKIIRKCPRHRQTMFFSATISDRIQKLADRYMHHPTKILVQNQVDPAKLKQTYYDISRTKKLSLLIHLLQNEKSDLVMVFTNSRKATDFVVKNLKINGVRAIAIHGGLSQNKRSRTIQLFNDRKAGVWVCTDVAARGLHIDNVTHIYNYDIPRDPNDYVHRIGRTARAGEEGTVINLLSSHEYDNFTRVKQAYSSFRIDVVPTPQIRRAKVVMADSPRRGRSFGGRRGPRRSPRPGFRKSRGFRR
jgi:ATP-dependent RNA helicase DeaD